MIEMSASVSPTQVLIPLPIVITGVLGITECSDLSGFDSIYSSLGVSVGLPGVSDANPLSLLSYNIASVGVAGACAQRSA